MTRFVLIILFHALFVAAGLSAAEVSNAQQEEAVAAIKQMKGSVVVDTQRPGKPVTEVHLYAGKTAGIGLAPLAKLPETAAKILRLQFIEGRSQEEIAASERLSIPAVKTRVHRAKKLFKQAYDEQRTQSR